jgi:hypothetical protein
MPVSVPRRTALLLGEPGRLPFLGHFRFHRESGAIRLSGAGRVAPRAGAETAFAAARAIEHALVGATGADRGAMLHDAWARLADARAAHDFAVVLVAEDEGGVDAAATGIGAWWGMTSGGATADLALPTEMRQTIAIHPATMLVVGAPTGLVLAAPTRDDVATRCGLHT